MSQEEGLRKSLLRIGGTSKEMGLCPRWEAARKQTGRSTIRSYLQEGETSLWIGCNL